MALRMGPAVVRVNICVGDEGRELPGLKTGDTTGLEFS